ncbi:hypothetical protein A9K55_005408 [Cordyceps militaris]|uniref:Uncharacterized protein n=1 Tax=Cordyceps militaris TaxID=73501 RepID=A0A2H4SDN6_CORMI|nr:hypothetical protein A9K55_005408 [Cordyceps militaris]
MPLAPSTGYSSDSWGNEEQKQDMADANRHPLSLPNSTWFPLTSLLRPFQGWARSSSLPQLFTQCLANPRHRPRAPSKYIEGPGANAARFARAVVRHIGSRHPARKFNWDLRYVYSYSQTASGSADPSLSGLVPCHAISAPNSCK